MKVLVGICGIGNGHLNRQTNVINLLLANNHENGMKILGINSVRKL